MKTILEIILQELPHLGASDLEAIRTDIDRLTGNDDTWRAEAKRLKETKGSLWACSYIREARGLELKVCKQIVDQL